MNREKTTNQPFDFGLITIVFLLGLVSIIAVYSATNEPFPPYFFMIRQLIWYIVGAVVIGIILLVDYQKVRDLAYILYGFGILLLIYVAMFGVERKGAEKLD